jgi:hypothetical protein
MELRGKECGGIYDRDKWRALMSTVMNFRVPLNVGKLMSS